MGQESSLPTDEPVIPSKVLNKIWIYVRANKEPSNKVPETNKRKIEEKKDERTHEKKKEDYILHESEEDLEESVCANKEPSNKVPEAKRRKFEEKTIEKKEKEIPKKEGDILHESKEDLEEYDYDNFSTTVGKWMLFLDIKHESEARGMTDHDYAWQSIKRLVETRGQQVGLIGAKCSTGWRLTTDIQLNPKGLICCYTSNFNDKSQVKKAGDAIREVVSYNSEMYYKTDNDTHAGKYTKNGNKCVSIYKHSRDSKMFERDELIPYQWNRVDV